MVMQIRLARSDAGPGVERSSTRSVSRPGGLVVADHPGAVYLVFFLTFCAAIAFALYTRLAWEDWYITFRASKNLALGNGLTFTPGERIHSFTSPLGTLTPALLSAAVANSSDAAVLWMYRVVSAAMLGFGAAILWVFGRYAGMSTLSRCVMVGGAVLECKTLANTIDGMESGFVIFFLALNIFAMAADRRARCAPLLGVAWAGLMWSRPDGFIYVVALCAGFLLFRPFALAEVNPWRDRWSMLKQWTVAAGIGILIYAPWVLWAWDYYGSPIPHTILAKGLRRSSALFGHGPGGAMIEVLRDLRSFLQARPNTLPATFLPPYAADYGGWPRVVSFVSRRLAWACALVWIVPYFRLGALLRAISFAAFVAQFYLAFGMSYAYPWYYPPATTLSMIVVALALDRLFLHEAGTTGLRFPGRFAPVAHVALAPAPLLYIGAISLVAAAELRVFQSVIYDRNTEQIGLFLRDHAASPRDTVFLEPLGYIGFFSES